MKKFVRFLSLCVLFVILCSLSLITMACSDDKPKIEGNYTDANNNFYEITKKDNKYSIIRFLNTTHGYTKFDNFFEIDDNGRYCWIESEPLVPNSDAPNGQFRIEIYSFTNEKTGEVFWYVEDFCSESNYHKQTRLTPAKISFDEWQHS